MYEVKYYLVMYHSLHYCRKNWALYTIDISKHLLEVKEEMLSCQWCSLHIFERKRLIEQYWIPYKASQLGLGGTHEIKSSKYVLTEHWDPIYDWPMKRNGSSPSPRMSKENNVIHHHHASKIGTTDESLSQPEEIVRANNLDSTTASYSNTDNK